MSCLQEHNTIHSCMQVLLIKTYCGGCRLKFCNVQASAYGVFSKNFSSQSHRRNPEKYLPSLIMFSVLTVLLQMAETTCHPLTLNSRSNKVLPGHCFLQVICCFSNILLLLVCVTSVKLRIILIFI